MSKQTEILYLKKRIKKLEEDALYYENVITDLVNDLAFTESVGCAFAFDLARQTGDADDAIRRWDDAMKANF